MDKQRVIAISVSAGGILGTFLPWASVGGLFSVEGTRGDGWITLVLFAGAIAISATGDRALPMGAGRGFAVYLLGLLALAAGLYDSSELARQTIQMRVGSGLYLVIATAAVVMFVSSLSANLALTVATVVFGGLVTFAGFVHFTETASGAKVCRKEQWSLLDTFINVDSLVGKPTSSLPPNVAKALLDCGAVTLQKDSPADGAAPQPDARSETRPGAEFAGVPCTVPNAREFHGGYAKGQCTDENDCGDGFIMYAGFCRGPANIVCCVKEP